MNSWTRHPVIFEINTWVWLNELSEKYSRPITHRVKGPHGVALTKAKVQNPLK